MAGDLGACCSIAPSMVSPSRDQLGNNIGDRFQRNVCSQLPLVSPLASAACEVFLRLCFSLFNKSETQIEQVRIYRDSLPSG